MRSVRGARRIVEKERLIRSGFLLPVDIEDRLVCDLVAQVTAIGSYVRLILYQIRLVLVRLRAQESEEVIEALSGWPTIEGTGIGRFFVRCDSILADRKGVVAVVALDFRNGSGGGRNPAIPARKTGRNRNV